jgi:hypothetical protein
MFIFSLLPPAIDENYLKKSAQFPILYPRGRDPTT